MEPILVVMAAGLGSRYGGNKQIDKISNEGDIIMDFSLFDARRAGFKKVIFVINEALKPVLEEHLMSTIGDMMDYHFVFQKLSDIPDEFEVPDGRVKPWGTGHAIYSARDYIDAPFAVINADDYYGNEAFQLIYNFLSSKADKTHHCMVGFNIENTLSENGSVSRGICKEKNNYLTYIEEHTDVHREKDGTFKDVITGKNMKGECDVIPDGTSVSMNLWGFGKEYIDVIKKDLSEALRDILDNNPLKGEFYLPTSIGNQVAENKASVEILHSPDRWFGVTYKEDKPLVVATIEEMKRARIYPRILWEKSQ